MRTSDLPQKIANQISLEIASGALRPGDHLGTQPLAHRFEVSRSPVRQALSLLAARGVVIRRQNRGFFVAESSLAAVNGAGHRAFDEISDYHRLADDWLADRIPAEVTEQSLRQRYGLTKTRLTDILMRAVREGWAERKQGNGWRFLPVAKTPEAFEQVYRFRLAIEPAAMLEPGFRPDRDILRKLRDTQQRMIDSDIQTLPAEHLLENGSTFHEEIIRMSGNPFFHVALMRANRTRRLMEYRARIDRTRLYRQCREHVEIVDCLLRGDVPGASYLMRAHLMGALKQKSAIARSWAGDGAVSDGLI